MGNKICAHKNSTLSHAHFGGVIRSYWGRGHCTPKWGGREARGSIMSSTWPHTMGLWGRMCFLHAECETIIVFSVKYVFPIYPVTETVGLNRHFCDHFPADKMHTL